MLPEHVRGQVLELYREVDEAVAAAGPVCVASGRCCRFKEYGHVLFLSNLEADVLLAEAPPSEPPATPDFCPFQKENLCTARRPRPLGCRIYYCDPSYQETSQRRVRTSFAASSTWLGTRSGMALRSASYLPGGKRRGPDLIPEIDLATSACAQAAGLGQFLQSGQVE